MAHDAPHEAISAKPLRGGAYEVGTAMGHGGFIVGDKGVIVVDVPINPDAARAMQAAIAKVTDKPIGTIIITHPDPDHVGGLPAFADSVDVIAHENVRAVLTASIASSEKGGPVFGALIRNLAGHLPKHTIHASQSITIDGVRIDIINAGPAHSSSDLAVYLPAQKIVYAGDLLVNDFDYPVIHLGGSSAGWLNAMKTILALDADIYVPGHGPILSKQQLRERYEKVAQRREAIKVMAYAGRSLKEVEAALPEAPITTMPFPSFNETTYREMTSGYPTAFAPWDNLIAR